MTAPKRLEIQRQVSRQDRRCRDDLDSGFFRFWGRVGERTHELPACQLVPRGLVATNCDTSGQKRPRKRGAEERVVECSVVEWDLRS